METGGGNDALRQLEPHWNHGMIAASIAISLLGAFTSTQLYVPSHQSDMPLHFSNRCSRMCQAKVVVGFYTVFVWTLLGSLTFGFCSIWCLHFVATLAYELDILVGINIPLTILSSVLAVVFTFAALGSDLLWDTYHGERQQRKSRNPRKWKAPHITKHKRRRNGSSVEDRPLLGHREDVQDISPDLELGRIESHPDEAELDEDRPLISDAQAGYTSTLPMVESSATNSVESSVPLPELDTQDGAESATGRTESSKQSVSVRSSSLLGSSSTSTFGFSSIINIAHRSATPAKNIFIATGEAVYRGCTRKNIAKGFLWSLAITTMHYAGLAALDIPSGYFTLNYSLVALSGIISWFVCVVGCILMSQMETQLNQQFLFSITATSGVAGMHFTGKSFWSLPLDIL
jgi:NO-binding membrane sensor protein with MHYT domain